jgi:hypothetical protein
VNAVEFMTLMIIIGLTLGWWITCLAIRVDRAHARAERAWAVLDAALARRAERARELVLLPGIDPATALLVSDAAATALVPNLSRHDRERAESDLSQLLNAVGSMPPETASRLDVERARASICRRLHNDAVATALSLRRRYTIRILRLARRAAEPRPFEMADSTPDCAHTPGQPDWPHSSLAYVRPAGYPAEPPELGWARDR